MIRDRRIYMDNKEMVLTSIKCDLLDVGFDAETIKIIATIIDKNVEDYDIVKQSHELAVVDTESEKMLKMFLATKKIEGCSDKTINRYAYVINRLTDYLCIPVSKITTNHLRVYLATLESEGKQLSTLAGIRDIFSSYFNWLHNENLISTNPIINLGKIKREKKVRLPYSKVDIEKLRLGCKTKRDRAVIEFLNSTACRVGELVKVDISDIDFKNRECKVHGKGNKERVVFLTDVCVYHMQEYLKERTDNSPSFLIGKGTERMTEGGIRFALKTIADRSQIESNVHPHRFRRTVATSLIDRGVAIQDVAAILGHVNVNTTMTYIYSNTNKIKSSFFSGDNN